MKVCIACICKQLQALEIKIFPVLTSFAHPIVLLYSHQKHSSQSVSVEILSCLDEKRLDPPAVPEESRKRKIEGDISAEVVSEILEAASEPMLARDVCIAS